MISALLRLLFTALISFIGLTLITFYISQQSPLPLFPYQESSSFGQYFEYLVFIFQGNWGYSPISGTFVLDDFLKHFPATLELLVIALFLAISLGIGLGILAAKNHGRWIDSTLMHSTLIGYSIPTFWLGLLLVLLFSLFLGVTPVAGRMSYEFEIQTITGFMLIDSLLQHGQGYGAFFSAINHLILPAITLSWVPMVVMIRVTRSSLVNIFQYEYIRTARAKGLSEARIITVHALRNAIQSLLTIGGLQISILMTGLIITEYIFAWPGVGSWLLSAIAKQDYASVQGGILALSSIVIGFNLLLDIIANYLDPRKRRPS